MVIIARIVEKAIASFLITRLYILHFLVRHELSRKSARRVCFPAGQISGIQLIYFAVRV